MADAVIDQAIDEDMPARSVKRFQCLPDGKILALVNLLEASKDRLLQEETNGGG